MIDLIRGPAAPRDRWAGVCFKGGGGGTTSTNTVEKADPWGGQQPYLLDIWSKARTAANESQNRLDNQGGSYVGPTGNQIAANDMLVNYADSMDYGLNPGLGFAQDTLGGKYLDVQNNPELQGAIQAALNPITERYTESIIPQLQASGVGAGAWGGAGEDFANAQVAQDYLRETGDATSRIAYQAYSDERNRQMMAPQIYNQALNSQLGLDMLPSEIYRDVGGQERAWQQEQMAALLGDPWAGLSQYSGVVQTGFPGGAYSSTSTGPDNSPSVGSRVLGGAMGGAGLAGSLGSLPGLGALGGPWGIAGGAILGGLAGGLF